MAKADTDTAELERPEPASAPAASPTPNSNIGDRVSQRRACYVSITQFPELPLLTSTYNQPIPWNFFGGWRKNKFLREMLEAARDDQRRDIAVDEEVRRILKRERFRLRFNWVKNWVKQIIYAWQTVRQWNRYFAAVVTARHTSVPAPVRGDTSAPSVQDDTSAPSVTKV